MFPKCSTVLDYHEGTDLINLEEALQAHRFVPCLDLQVASHGWSAVTEEGTLVHTAQAFKMLRFTLEKKTIPSSAFKVQLNARLAEMAKAQGFQPGRKVRKEVAEELQDELLVRQLAARKDVQVLVDTVKRRVLVDSTVPTVVGEICRSLAIHGGIELYACLVFGAALTSVAREALDDGLGEFELDDRAAVRFPGEQGPLTSWRQTDLADSSFSAALNRDATVTELGLVHGDKVSFVLSADGAIKCLKPTDILRTAAKDAADFDAGVVLAGLTLRALVDDLIALKESA